MNSVAIVSQDEKTRKYLEAKIIADTKDMPKTEWLKHRQAGIGGSDASCIAGLNPWKSAIQLYMDKKEENPQEVKSLRMELGNRLEGLVAELFLECKTTNSYALKEWEEGVPAHYEIQCLHYMAITGATHCYIAALIGNSDFIWHKIERDQETIDYLMQIEKDFWENNIEKDVVPMPDGSDAYSEYLKKKYDKSNGQVIELHLLENGVDKLNRYDEIVTDIKALESEKKLIEQEIQLYMEEFEVAKIGDRKVTWKSSSRNTIDSKKLKAEMPDIAQQYMKTSTSRTFRVGK